MYATPLNQIVVTRCIPTTYQYVYVEMFFAKFKELLFIILLLYTRFSVSLWKVLCPCY